MPALLPLRANHLSTRRAREACEFLKAILGRPTYITAGIYCDQEGALWRRR
jgi:hypothetical protein